VVSSVSKMIEKKYKDKWLKLELKCDDNVEKMVHNSSFEIIAKNLIENAFKYTDEWSIKITLNDKEFSVKDTWKWIKKENLEKIRDRFWQEDSSKTDVTSFGLWLYLVKLLVEKHWWNIEVKSNQWKWSEFKIMF
jgi:K+-sensing histidine kinase KdpD